ncbi:hypothetical protein [Actinobacillus porcinus]|uniref:hypothetical protein n=1 Tax=Actinobacillus porcinus TaxID=51048 RepID=UPI0023F0836C|nr:hypothetical protein [Actinobacillus porcinus]MDD7545108.1 hypothetical protein [Actinobacillus porcinus]MDY5847782.1 hypothetical protein [Actinobacillus porcinus]
MQNQNSVSKKITFGFLLAGLYNLTGILVPTKCFTDQTLATIDPVVFSWLGQVGIILWGLAYLSVSIRYHQVPKLILVFFIEKWVYVAAWAYWLMNNGDALVNLWNENLFLGIFFAIYGAGDFLFALFFGYVFIKTRHQTQ